MRSHCLVKNERRGAACITWTISEGITMASLPLGFSSAMLASTKGTQALVCLVKGRRKISNTCSDRC